MFQVKPCRDTEVDDLDRPFLQIDQDIEWTDVLVDDVVLVDFTQCICSADGHVEKIQDVVLFLLEDFLEGPGFEPIQEEGVAVFLFGAFEDVARAFEVEAFDDVVFVVELGDIIGGRKLEIEDLHDDGAFPLVVIDQVNFRFLAFVDQLLCHQELRYRLFCL